MCTEKRLAVKSSKQNIPISPEKAYGTSQDYQFYHQGTCYQAQAPYDRPQGYRIYQQVSSVFFSPSGQRF